MEKEVNKILEKLTAEDFNNAPITSEPHGDYQFIQIDGKKYYRDIETGEITD